MRGIDNFNLIVCGRQNLNSAQLSERDRVFAENQNQLLRLIHASHHVASVAQRFVTVIGLPCLLCRLVFINNTKGDLAAKTS